MSKDDYALGRSLEAGIRLNLQHFLWQKLFPYHIHPNVLQQFEGRADLKVADVGAGTGIWAMEVAEALGEQSQVDGFDIDLSQAPAPGFWPSNVKFMRYDVNDDVPAELESQYDVVNLRLFVFVVKNNDPTAVMKKLSKMLRPGGWLQWSEVDLSTSTSVFARGGLKNDATLKAKALLTRTDARFEPGTWIPALDEHFRRIGLQNVLKEARPMPLNYVTYQQQLVILLYKEILAKMPASTSKTEVEELIPEAAAETASGHAVQAIRLVVVGQKPEMTRV